MLRAPGHVRSPPLVESDADALVAGLAIPGSCHADVIGSVDLDPRSVVSVVFGHGLEQQAANASTVKPCSAPVGRWRLTDVQFE